MININSVLDNLITRYKAFTWNNGQTKLQDVFNFEHNSHTKGSPYGFVIDIPADSTTFTTHRFEGNVQIQLTIAVKWDTIEVDETDLSESEIEAAKRTEANTRLRTAFDAIRADLVKTSTLDAITGGQNSWISDISFANDDLEELSLYRKTCTITLMEYLER